MKIARHAVAALFATLFALPALSAPLTASQKEQVNNFAVGMESIRLASRSCPGWSKELQAKVEPVIRSGTRGLIATGIPESALAAQTRDAQALVKDLVKARGIDWFCAEFNETVRKQVIESPVQ